MAALYSTGTRDRFRIRLERGKEPGTTEIYLSHQGMEEVVASGSGSDHISTMWQGRPSDPELETEMLRLLMAHLGAKGPGRRDRRGRRAAARARQAGAHWRPHAAERAGRPRPRLAARGGCRPIASVSRSRTATAPKASTMSVTSTRTSGQEARVLRAPLRRQGKIPQEQYRIQLKAADSSTDVAVLDKEGRRTSPRSASGS